MRDAGDGERREARCYHFRLRSRFFFLFSHAPAAVSRRLAWRVCAVKA